jgi:hypothetical protein
MHIFASGSPENIGGFSATAPSLTCFFQLGPDAALIECSGTVSKGEPRRAARGRNSPGARNTHAQELRRRSQKGDAMNKTAKMMLMSAVLVFGAASLANAQGRNCAPRDAVVERLATHYGETRQSMGLGSNNAVMEVYASTETGTWTITVTLTSGLTCLVASGQAFEELAEALPPKGDPA